MSLKKIDQLISRVRTNGDKFNSLVHDTAVLILMHAQEHGDCSRAKDLALAMPASMRRTMLIEWFNTFSPIRIILPPEKNKDGKVGMLKADAKGYTPFDIDAGRDLPWFKMAEATPEEKSYDYAALVAMAKRLAKQIEGKIGKGLVAENDVEAGRELARKLAAVA